MSASLTDGPGCEIGHRGRVGRGHSPDPGRDGRPCEGSSRGCCDEGTASALGEENGGRERARGRGPSQSATKPKGEF